MIDPVETFKTEAREHLVALEEALLELENSPDDRALLDTAFRSMHTIKGAAGMFGYQNLTDFTHHLETALDKVRNGALFITPPLIGLMLDAGDAIGDSLENPKFTSHQKILFAQLLERLFEIAPDSVEQSAATDNTHDTPKPKKANNLPDIHAFRIRFTPDAFTFQSGLDVVPILRELSALGECEVTTISDDLPLDESFDPITSYLRWDVILGTEKPLSDVEDTFMFVQDDWAISIEEIDLTDADEVSDRVGELLVSRGLLAPQQLDDVLNQHTAIGEQLSQQGLASQDEIKAALSEQKVVRNLKQNQQAGQDATIRVPALRLDNLMNLVGELVIVQARLNQYTHHNESEELISISEELDMLTTQMRDQTFSIRMVPIGTTFGRFRRLVRDLSQELGKSISLATNGEDTELDKMVIDKLADPLIHLIRNSIDHGIETKEERLAAYKAETGSIILSAEHSDSHVVIRICDDGRGLNTQRIRAKAVEKGVIAADAELSDDAIHNLIFEPGFSTSEQVSDISGRGVGMDVVKRSIHELGGNISISTGEGIGTDFTIRLPMTMAIIEGLMVQVGDENYVLPLSVVEECIELTDAAEAMRSRKRLVELRGSQIPFMFLREWFGVESPRPAIEQIVIVQIGQERFGFCVDEVIGQYQTVIKRLGKIYEGVTGFSGATILGDGSVAMILDPMALMEAAEHHSQHPPQHAATMY